MKYIDSEKLKISLFDLKEYHKYYNGDFHDGVVFAVDEMMEEISSLQQEQPKVDFEKEFQEYWYLHQHDHRLRRQVMDGHGKAVLENIARHFYGLRNRALEEAARHLYESWMGGTMNDVRRDMVELGKVLNERKDE